MDLPETRNLAVDQAFQYVENNNKQALLKFYFYGALTASLTVMALFCLGVLVPVCHAQVIVPADKEYTNAEIVEAIYQAEGGPKTVYPYGILSVKCEGKEACQRICQNTVKNNRSRYAQSNTRKNESFLMFLGARYCPIGAKNDPNRINQNWLKNVRYFLAKNRAVR